VHDLLSRWVKLDGAFRARELWFGWDNVPMHRWAQSQVFRSLSLLALRESISTWKPSSMNHLQAYNNKEVVRP